MESVSISQTKNCYGCGVCAIVCPKGIIRIELNKEGFYDPVLFDEESCTKCGLCISVCAYNSDSLLDSNARNADTYAAWSNDSRLRLKCTSGGLGFELAIYLINEGYKACGVKYNPEFNRAEHFVASTVDEYIPSIGSKYIQSYTLTGFYHINRIDKFFVTGTPCQIDSIRRYIRKLKIEKNFVLMDFFCHGVPSMSLWKKYTEMVEKRVGKIKDASWRNKITTWHNSCAIGIQSHNSREIFTHSNYSMLIEGKREFDYLSFLKDGDLFYEFFLNDLCLGRACYGKCKYKLMNSAADIRVGDLWGKKYKDAAEGVSGLIAFTERGKNVLSSLDRCTLIREDVDVVAEIQQKVPLRTKFARRYFLRAFNSNLSLDEINRLYQIYLLPERIIGKLSSIVYKMKKKS